MGHVFLVGAGPGDPLLLTLKAKAVLEKADVVVYDRLVSQSILEFAADAAEMIYVGKSPNHHTLPQREIDALLVKKAREGHTVVRLKGGDPFVFGRGAEEAEALRAHGVPYEVVPGVSSVTAAPAYAGIPLTHRSLAAGFHVVTGHECLQSTGTPWGALAEPSQTVVILMGMANLREIADRLVHFGRRGDTPVAVVRLGTTPEQQTVVGTLESIADIVARSGIEPPAVIVVGDVVRMHEQLDWFDPKAMSRDERVAASGATSL